MTKPARVAAAELPAELPAELQALFDSVQAEPWAFDFFALVRRVEALQQQLPRIGTASRPGQEVLRLGQDAQLDFAPAALSSFRQEPGQPPRLGVRFFGMLGPQGPMPLHFTEYVRERQHNHGDPTLVHFLDIFHHRLLELFYRAWAHTQPVVQRDRPRADRYAAWLGTAFGHRTGAGDTIPEPAKLNQAGLLAGRSRHPEGLVKLLVHHFDVPAAVVPHVGHWMSLHADDRSRLGYARNRAAAGQGAQLGRSACAGDEVWDRQYKFRIVLGPLTLEQYLGFLPGHAAWQRLVDWVQLYAGLDLFWDVELTLRRDQVPPPRLGRHMRLGLAAWLPSAHRPPRHRSDLHLRPRHNLPPRFLGAPHG